MSDVEISKLLSDMKDVMAKLPSKDDLKIQVTSSVNVDGKEIGRSVASGSKQASERRGDRTVPGAARSVSLR